MRGHIANDVSPNPSSGGVNGRLSVAGLKIQLKEPFFSLNDLVMEKTDAEFTMSGGNIRLTALTFDGPMVEGRITGVIDIRQPMQDSRLNLSGNVKPRPDLIARLQESLPAVLENVRTLGTRGLNFRVRGTIDNPDLSMR
ncbi:type II secretion system protein GspN [Desulfosarcina cetonica]|uniref:type II secretion system protein GspN n=1 Tax=Desulfosarcina cetonica TaxID=90730 RepID=UPI001C472D16|nr:type II secretion system protein GspN [Desulfosarcina cetonica]